MRKLIFIKIFIFLLIFSACQEIHEKRNIKKASDYYSIRNVLEQTTKEYYYNVTLKSKQGNTLFQASYKKDPRDFINISLLNDNVLKYSTYIGTGVYEVIYFDLKNETKSIAFPFVEFEISDENIIFYMDYIDNGSKQALIIRNIFDKNISYTEIKRNYSNAANPKDNCVNIKLIDNNVLFFTYLTAPNYIEVSEKIPLKNWVQAQQN